MALIDPSPFTLVWRMSGCFGLLLLFYNFVHFSFSLYFRMLLSEIYIRVLSGTREVETLNPGSFNVNLVSVNKDQERLPTFYWLPKSR